MMKKLAVTVFVASIAAFGCGSDDGTPVKTDGGKDTRSVDAQSIDVQVKTDLPVVNRDAPLGSETQPDVSVDQGPQQIDTSATIDAEKAIDSESVLDVGKPDMPVMPSIDGGADVQQTEAMPPVTVDGGSMG